MSTVTLGERIRALRQAQGWTLAVLASKADASVSYLNDLEHDRSVPSLGKLAAVAEALGLSVTELLSGTNPYDQR